MYCVAVCCGVLQCVAVYCSALQYFAMCHLSGPYWACVLLAKVSALLSNRILHLQEKSTVHSLTQFNNLYMMMMISGAVIRFLKSWFSTDELVV